MKTQMRFQKILMYVSLVVGALTFVFALGFLTGSLGHIYYYVSQTGSDINCENFLYTSQSYVSTLVALSIVFIVLAAVLFITSSHSRRNYYITNYIAIGVFIAFALAVFVFILVMVSHCMNIYVNEIAWDKVVQQPLHEISLTYTNFILGYVMAFIVLADAVCVALSLVWKILLMRGEKQLLAKSNSQVVENVNQTEEVA